MRHLIDYLFVADKGALLACFCCPWLVDLQMDLFIRDTNIQRMAAKPGWNAEEMVFDLARF
jgi:hypothetical protein